MNGHGMTWATRCFLKMVTNNMLQNSSLKKIKTSPVLLYAYEQPSNYLAIYCSRSYIGLVARMLECLYIYEL